MGTRLKLSDRTRCEEVKQQIIRLCNSKEDITLLEIINTLPFFPVTIMKLTAQLIKTKQITVKVI